MIGNTLTDYNYQAEIEAATPGYIYIALPTHSLWFIGNSSFSFYIAYYIYSSYKS